jgi:hypothetical protein
MITPTNPQNKPPANIKPKKYSAMDSTGVRNLSSLFENKAGAPVAKMIKSLPLC